MGLFKKKNKNVKYKKATLEMTRSDYENYVLNMIKDIILENTNHKIENIDEIKNMHYSINCWGDFYIEIDKNNFEYNKEYFAKKSTVESHIIDNEEDDKSYFKFSPFFNGFGDSMCVFIDMNDETPITKKIKYKFPDVAKPLTFQQQRFLFIEGEENTFSGMTLAVKYKGTHRKIVVLTESYTEKDKFYCLKEVIFQSEDELMNNYKRIAYSTLCNYPETRYLRSLDLEYICKNVYEMPFGQR